MDRVTDYVIVSSLNTIDLGDQVKKKLGDGWELIDGMVVAVERGQTVFCQTMVHRGARSGRGEAGAGAKKHA